MPVEKARAKVNLSLHIGAPIADPDDRFYGYHPLDSLVAFADIGDDVSCEVADTTSLTINGPFADGLEADENNLILKAYAAVAKLSDVPPLKFHLVKNLPVASGIGGGSADAAAALRLMKHYVELSEEKWLEIALSLGADVPVCFHSKTTRMCGIGEKLCELTNLGAISAVLINPGIAIGTGSVFQKFDAANTHIAPKEQMTEGDLLSRTLAGTNDLETISMSLCPEIGDVLRYMASQPGCQLARMSGSGATCFALFERDAQAHVAVEAISKLHPDWWVVATRIGDAA